MFDIAWSELLLIAVVALIFIGPKELPQVLHSLGKTVAKLRRSADDFRRHFEESMREAGYQELHQNLQDFRSIHPAQQLKESIDRAVNQTYSPPPVLPTTSLPAVSDMASEQPTSVSNEVAPPAHPSMLAGEPAPAKVNDAPPPVTPPVHSHAAPPLA